MSGKIMAAFMVLAALAIGGGLWYSLNYSYYTQVTQLRVITAFGDEFPVANYQGIDATSSPLKMRACFDVEWDYIPSEEHKEEAAPLNAPFWFDCFDATKIGEDLRSDKATALLADSNDPYGFNTFIAQYPDGKAYMWRQINDCGEAAFRGDDLPEGCPDPEAEPDEGVAAVGDSSGAVTIKMSPLSGDPAEEVQIDGLTVARAPTDPTQLWACFTTPLSYGFITETYEIIAGQVTPTQPSGALPCFDGQSIQDDVLQGTAIAVLGEANIALGYDRIIAVYEDGRAFAWHQKQAE